MDCLLKSRSRFSPGDGQKQKKIEWNNNVNNIRNNYLRRLNRINFAFTLPVFEKRCDFGATILQMKQLRAVTQPALPYGFMASVLF